MISVDKRPILYLCKYMCMYHVCTHSRTYIHIYTSEQEPIVCRELLFKLYRILYSVPSLRSRFIFIQHSRHHDQVQHSRHLNLDCTNFSLSVSLYLVSRELYIQKYTSTTVTPKEKQTQEPNRSNSISRNPGNSVRRHWSNPIQWWFGRV